MAEELQGWSNQDAENKSLQELAILFQQAVDKINELEQRVSALE